MDNFYRDMNVAEIRESISVRGTENEDEATLALGRLADIAEENGCTPLLPLSLRMLAEMPGLVSFNYAERLESAASAEITDTARDILECAAAVLRTNEE